MSNLLNQLIVTAGASPPWSYLILLIPLAAMAGIAFIIWHISDKNLVITGIAIAVMLLVFGGISLSALGVRGANVSAHPGEPITIEILPRDDRNHAPGMEMPRSRLAGLEGLGITTEGIGNAGAGIGNLPDPWGPLPEADADIITTTIPLTGTASITGTPTVSGTVVLSTSLPFSGTHPATLVLTDWVNQGNRAARQLRIRRETLGADIGAPAAYLHIWALDLKARISQEPPEIRSSVPITDLVEATETLVSPYRMIRPSDLPTAPSETEFSVLVSQLSTVRFLVIGDYLDLDARLGGLTNEEIVEECNRQLDRLTPALTSASALSSTTPAAAPADQINTLSGIIADLQQVRLHLKAAIDAAGP